jgi:hypothetical protein
VKQQTMLVGAQENRVIPLVHQQCANPHGTSVLQGFSQQLISLFSVVLGNTEIG